MKVRDHVAQMGKFQNETWGLEYIDLYLMHFPVALEYIEPSKLQYPVSSQEYKVNNFLRLSRHGGWTPVERLSL